MVRSTIIARIYDGLILAESLDDEETEDLSTYKTQAKLLIKKLNSNSESKCSIESNNYIFHYLISMNVCYLVICDRSYPKKLAFSFLDIIRQEFQSNYGSEIGMVSRPYAFVKFDPFIQRTKKQFQDTSKINSLLSSNTGNNPNSQNTNSISTTTSTSTNLGNNNLNQLNRDLQDVSRIMTKNISEVLGRGESLDKLSVQSQDLRDRSKAYLKQTKHLNLQAFYQKYGPPLIVLFVILFVLYIRYYLW